jgi:hypothetical protein
MPQHIPTVEEWEGYGSYERVGRDPGLVDALRWGVYQPLGQVPELSKLLEPLSATVEVNGILRVRTELVEPAVAALESMKLTGVSPDAVDPIDAKATWVANFPSATDWVHQAVAAGQAVLVQPSSVMTGSPSVCLTSLPAVIAERCRRAGGWALVVAPQQLIDAAVAIAGAKAGVPSACPPGTVLSSSTGLCVAAATAAPAAAPKALAPWVIPVAVGGGALLIVGLLVVAQREPKQPRATANPRRRRRPRRPRRHSGR